MRIGGFTFYFGAASGSSRKALRQLEETDVMINYATENNKPWEIDNLFTDSGGYSFMKGKGEYETTNEEYLDYVEEHQPEIFALRDYPCEPDVLEKHGRTVQDHQRMTTEKHTELWDALEDRNIDGEPLSVIQGWGMDDYLSHLDTLRDHGLLSDRVGIGSVCRRNREAEIRRIILAVRDSLPSRYGIHAFGVKGSVLQYPDVRDALDSADSNSFDMQRQWGSLKAFGPGHSDWKEASFYYLKQRRQVKKILLGRDDEGEDTVQQGLPNRNWV